MLDKLRDSLEAERERTNLDLSYRFYQGVKAALRKIRDKRFPKRSLAIDFQQYTWKVFVDDSCITDDIPHDAEHRFKDLEDLALESCKIYEDLGLPEFNIVLPKKEETKCSYNIAYRGRCRKDTVDDKTSLCDDHHGTRCESCGAPATHECCHTHGLVCGTPLCDDCTHAYPPDGIELPPHIPMHLRKADLAQSHMFLKLSSS